LEISDTPPKEYENPTLPFSEICPKTLVESRQINIVRTVFDFIFNV
jgi:hypothetical protein